MKENIIKTKSFKFALKVVEIYKFLIENKKEYVLSKQILRSGTSIGAMIYESEHAESKQDFIHKLAIAQKEANETKYWIELLSQSQFINRAIYDGLVTDIEEIQKIISSSIITSKKSLEKYRL
ncbi:four helix bundle protein [Candidatus Azambacteria bacterium]|nr:four helix bundle protein [Candidatus Azambacteria bacterium]